MNGAYKLEGAIGEVSSLIQVPRLRRPQKTAPSEPVEEGGLFDLMFINLTDNSVVLAPFPDHILRSQV